MRSCITTILILAGLALAADASTTPLTVDQCLRQALAANPTLEAAGAQLAAAAAASRRARAAYYPMVDLQATYGLTDNPPQAFMMSLNQRSLDISDPSVDPNNPDDTDNLRLSATLRWQLYDGGQRRSRYAMANQRTEAASLRHDAACNHLIFEIIRGYYQSLQAMALEHVRSDAVASLATSLRIAEARFAAGAAIRTDVLNLKVKLAGAQAAQIRAANGTQLAIAALNTAIGHPFVTPARLALPVAFEPPPPPPYVAEQTVEQRAEYQAALVRMQVTALDRQRASARRLPDLNAFGSYDLDGAEFDEFEGSYFAGLQATWPIFTGFEHSGDIDQARANSRTAAAQARRLQLRLELELEQARLAWQESNKRRTVALAAVESAEEALRITRTLYKEGATDISQLLVAEVGQTDSRARAATAFFDVRIAEARVGRANGTLASHTLAALGTATPETSQQ